MHPPASTLPAVALATAGRFVRCEYLIGRDVDVPRGLASDFCVSCPPHGWPSVVRGLSHWRRESAGPPFSRLSRTGTRQGHSTRRGLYSPSMRGSTSTTWSIDRGTCPSSLSSWRRGCHLRPSRPRRSKSTSSTRSDIVQVRAEVLVRLPGVAVGAVALPEARKHVPVADAAVGAHPLQHNLLVQDSPLPYLRNVWWHCARSAKSFVPRSEDGSGGCNARSLVMVQ